MVGRHVQLDKAALACRVDADRNDHLCRRCGCENSPRATVTRLLVQEPGLVPPTRSRSWIPSTSSVWPAKPWTVPGAGSSTTCTGTGAAPATRSTRPAGLCIPDDLLADRRRQRRTTLFELEEHVQVETIWGIHGA